MFRGQSLQELSLILGLIVLVGVTAVGQLGGSIQQLLGGVAAANVTQPTLALLENGAGGSRALPYGTFTVSGDAGTHTFRYDPDSEQYVLSDSTNGMNTTGSEGDRLARLMSLDMLSTLAQLATAETAPDGQPLTDEDRALLSQLVDSGYGVTDAQYWLMNPASEVYEAGLGPWGNDWMQYFPEHSWTQLAFANQGNEEETAGDLALVHGFSNRYNGFKSAYEQLTPLLEKNLSLRNTINPLVATLDSISYNRFLNNPNYLGKNPVPGESEGNSLFYDTLKQEMGAALHKSFTPPARQQASPFSYDAVKELAKTVRVDPWANRSVAHYDDMYASLE